MADQRRAQDVQAAQGQRALERSPRPHLVGEARRRPAQARPARRQRVAAGRRLAGEAHDVGDRRAGRRPVGAVGRDHQDRQDQAVPGARRLEPAGQAGEVRLGAGRRRRHGMEPALEHPFGIGEAPAHEHRVGDVRRGRVARHLHGVAGGADLPDRHQGGPQVQGHRVAGPGHRGGERRPGRRLLVGRDQDARPVAPEHERQLTPVQGVAQGGDHRRPGEVHRPVAPRRDGTGGIDHVGHRHPPAVRHGAVLRVVEHAQEVRRRGEVGVAEALGRRGRAEGRRYGRGGTRGGVGRRGYRGLHPSRTSGPAAPVPGAGVSAG